MKVQIIIGSTRPGRVTDRVANWVALEAKNLADTTVEIVDLRDHELPLFDEPVSPQYNPNRTPVPAVKAWLDTVGQADAYILVTPEYNRALPAVLKNAIDYLDFQFAKKPAMLVAHGSSGGAQAVATLRITLPGVGAVTIPQAVFLVAQPAQAIDEQGNLSEELKANPYGPQANLKAGVEALQWYSDALSAARA